MAIDTIIISGAQICDYLWVLNRKLNASEIAFVNDYANEPEWTIDTELLVTFNESLMAGNITTATSTPTSWEIYRQQVGDDNLVLAANVDENTKSFIDYNVCNNSKYIYKLFATTSSYITAPITSKQIATEWQTWSLFDVDPTDTDGTFTLHEIFLFGVDLVGGQMPNNIQVAQYTNFTEFPKVHKAASNFYSGALTALLGQIDCDTGEYSEDGYSKEAALKKFSTNPRRKFLKDIRGHIWEVEITSLAFTTRDGYIGQPYDVQIGWLEKASADDLIITN